MKYFLKVLAFFIIGFASFQAHSQSLKICQEGISKCQPLVQDSKKYSRCMRLMCFDYYTEEDKKRKDEEFYFEIAEDESGKKLEKTVETCENGLRRCEPLSTNLEYYWECMADTCQNLKGLRPDCDNGINLCLDRQKIYNDCMDLTCGSPIATFESCPESRFSCIESFKAYWLCVYDICLGPVDEYIRPSNTKKFIIVKDSKGNKRRIRVDKKPATNPNAPLWSMKAPEWVDPEEWIRTTPQKFMLIGTPSEYMECLVPTAMIYCSLNDIRSCRCSDGSIPIMTKGTPSPSWKD
jgi:hypothetical protein